MSIILIYVLVRTFIYNIVVPTHDFVTVRQLYQIVIHHSIGDAEQPLICVLGVFEQVQRRTRNLESFMSTYDPIPQSSNDDRQEYRSCVVHVRTGYWQDRWEGHPYADEEQV